MRNGGCGVERLIVMAQGDGHEALVLTHAAMMARARKDPRALGWLSACHLMHAERVNIRRTVRHPLVDVSSTAETWRESKRAAIKYASEAMKRLARADDDGPGRTFCETLISWARRLVVSDAPLVNQEEVATARRLVASRGHILEEHAIAASALTLDDLAQYVSRLTGGEWLA